MSNEAAEQVLTRVLGEHRLLGAPFTIAEVAAELAAALCEAGLLVEGETVDPPNDRRICDPPHPNDPPINTRTFADPPPEDDT